MGREAEASGEGAGSETGRSEDRGRRFAAFISYSHADKEAAAKLQRRLERYRLPKHLAIERADGAAAIGRIFRDREDLAAAPSLSDAIRDAIARADALIVVCSPDACASRWVSEEITLFRTLHPDRPILAALVGGDHSTAFPEALTQRGTEPLAADLRKDGDGQTLGFLKIVAGIAGVPLDALVQRDAQRRVRRVTWITAGALAAMLVMGVMTTLAIQARNEAARQRASAEGMVEYMLTDLRQKLKGVGRLDVMNAVNERAMQHYSMQGNLSALSADSLERRARLLHAMGEDDELSGDLDSALAKFREARRSTAAVLAKKPSDADAIFAHAQSEYWVGYIYFLKRQKAATGKHWREYVALAENMVKIAPNDPRSLKEVGYSRGNLCSLALEPPIEIESAVEGCASALEAELVWAEKYPRAASVRLDLANRYAWNAEALLASGQVKRALAERQKQIALIDDEIKLRPADKDVLMRKAMSELSMSDVWEKLGDRPSALAALDRSILLLKQLVEFDPSNVSNKRWLASTLKKRERYK